jgi:hypothetical protein
VDLAVSNPDPVFVAGVGAAQNREPGVSTIITPNGQQAKVGGGIMISLSGDESQRLKIAELAKGKENIILSVATDAAGKQHHSISVGDKTYVVEKEKLGDLPADIRPLAEQLLRNGPQQTVKQGGAASLEQTVADQAREIEMLKQRIGEIEKGKSEKK